MEKLSEERKADIRECLYKIKRIVNSFQDALSINFRYKDEDVFYRFFVRELHVEISWLRELLNEEGGEA